MREDRKASRRNVALVISNLEFGGAQRQLVELANNLSRDRFDVHVYSLSEYVPLAQTLKLSPTRLRVVKKKSKYDLSVVPRLAALFREHTISRNAKEYFTRHHAAGAAMPAFESVLTGVSDDTGTA